MDAPSQVYDFTSNASPGTSIIPGDRVDAQFANHANAIVTTQDAVADVRRADGALKNGIVTRDSLDEDLQNAIPEPGDVPPVAQWAEVSRLWAEHMPGTIPENNLAIMDITGEHWSARWHAKQAKDEADRAVATTAEWEVFKDFFVGAHDTPPTTNADGEPLVDGAVYYNTTNFYWWFWNGTEWSLFSVPAEGRVSSVNGVDPDPSGDVALDATDLSYVPSLAGTFPSLVNTKLRQFTSLSDFVGPGETLYMDGVGNDAPVWQRAAASGTTVLIPPGSTLVNARINVSSGTTFWNPGRSCTIIAGPSVALTIGLFENLNDNVVTANLRTDVDIAFLGLVFDGSQRTYPKYLWNTGTNSAVTTPATDPTRNSGYAVRGYMISLVNCVRCTIRGCTFQNHGGDTVRVSGCLLATVADCDFFNCGRVDYSSNCIYVNHTGAQWTVWGAQKGATTTLFLDAATGASPTYAVGQQIWVGYLAGLRGVIPNGLYTITANDGVSPQISINADTSSAAVLDFIMDGRGMVGSTFLTLSEHCLIDNCRGFSINRALIQVGASRHVTIRAPRIRNSRESGVYLSSAQDTTIIGLDIENVDMADIVAAAVELNYCVNTKILGGTIQNTQTYAISVVGAIGLDIIDLDIVDPVDTPGFVHPYGPFGESGGWSGTLTISGTAVTAMSPPINFSGLLSGKIISPNTPAGTTITWASDGATTGTLAVAGTGGTTIPARINKFSSGVYSTPGEPLQDYKRHALFMTANGNFPIEQVRIRGGRLTDQFIRNATGAILVGLSGGAPRGSIRNFTVEGWDLSKFGRRGRVAGVLNEASPCTIISDRAHRLVAGFSVYLSGVAAPLAVNGGPYVIALLATGSTTLNGAISAGATSAVLTAPGTIQIGHHLTGSGFHPDTVVTGVSGSTVTFAPALVSNMANGASLAWDSDFAFKIAVGTSSARAFVQSNVGWWQTTDPAKDFNQSSTDCCEDRSIRFKTKGNRYERTEPLVEFLTETQSWVKPLGARRVNVRLGGAGGPGGGGAKVNSGTAASGGAGGGGGAIVECMFEADDLANSYTVTLPAPPAGGAGATVVGGGGVGTRAADSTFGSLLTAFAGGRGAGGGSAAASGGGAGAGILGVSGAPNGTGATAGTASATLGSVAGGSGAVGAVNRDGGASGAGTASAGAGLAGGNCLNPLQGGAGGGSGAGLATTPVAQNGGAGGIAVGTAATAGGTGSGNAGGSAVLSAPTAARAGGGGGAGGSSHAAGNGGAGGNGGFSAGGGGGGASVGGNGGAGGVGGPAWAEITTYFED